MGGVVKNQHSKTHTHRNINVWPFSKGPFTTCCVHCVTHVSCKWIQLSTAYCMSALSTRAQRSQEHRPCPSAAHRERLTRCVLPSVGEQRPQAPPQPLHLRHPPSFLNLPPVTGASLRWQRPAFYLPSFKGLLKPSFSRRKAATGPSPFPGGSSRSGSNTWEGPWANWRSQRLQGRALHLYLFLV